MDSKKLTRQNTFTEKSGRGLDSVEIKKTSTLDAQMMPDAEEKQTKKSSKKTGDKQSDKAARNNTGTGAAKNAQLKKKAGSIPVRNANKTKKSMDRIEAQSYVKDVYDILKKNEGSVLGNAYAASHAPKLLGLDGSDLKKRTDKALKRSVYVDQIRAYEDSRMEEEERYPDIDELTAALKKFVKLPAEPYDLSTDEKFTANLARNYSLCDTALRMQKWVAAAVEGEYMPQGFDLSEIQTRIQEYLALKDFLDTQKELMKNPYYPYISKDDIRYSDSELEKLTEKTKGTDLKAYFNSLKKLRELPFMRDKGLKSVKERSLMEGKRMAKVLAEKNDKRRIISRIKEGASAFKGDRRFLDKDYDSRFSPELFDMVRNDFDKLNVTDIHFASIRDMADHFEHNLAVFKRASDMEHMLFLAVRNGVNIPDDELIKLRAKIRVFVNAQRNFGEIMRDMARQPEVYLNKTYDEIVNNKRAAIEKGEFPKTNEEPPLLPGMDLRKYHRNIVKQFKKEHEGRRRNIRLLYGMVHPDEVEKNGDLDIIPQDKLDEWMAGYQKNAVICDYLGDLQEYTHIQMEYAEIIGQDYMDKNHVKLPGGFGRTLSRYMVGRSADEIRNIIRIHSRGSEEEKRNLWKTILDEFDALDMNLLDKYDPESVLSNIAYSNRLYGQFTNMDQIANLKFMDDISKKKGYAICQIINSNNTASNAIARNMVNRKMKGLPISEWFIKDSDRAWRIDELLQNKYSGTIVGDRAGSWMKPNSFEDLTLRMSGINYHNLLVITDKRYAGINGTITVSKSKYDFYKKQGLWKDTGAEDLKKLQEFYNQNIDDKAKDKRNYPKENDALFKQIMNFDIQKFAFNSYAELISEPGKFAECADMAATAEEAIKRIDAIREKKYTSGNPELKKLTALDIPEINEVYARCYLVQSVGRFYGPEFSKVLQGVEKYGDGRSLDELLHLPDEFLEAEKAKAETKKDTDAQNYWLNLKDMIKTLRGFDAQTNPELKMSHIRKLAKVKGDSHFEVVRNILNGQKSVTGTKEFGEFKPKILGSKLLKEGLSPVFYEKNMSITDRYKKMDNPKSRLYTKRVNAELIDRQFKDAANVMILAKQSVSLNTRIRVGEDALNDLSAFMSDPKTAEAFASDYADEKKRFEVLDKITMEIRDFSFTEDIIEDADFARQAGALESMTRKVRAYRKLLKANPDYVNRLKVKSPGYKYSDYEQIQKRMSSMLAMSDYYRARKLLLTNAYFRLHYPDELCASTYAGMPEEQRLMADLINFTARCADRLPMCVFGDLTERDDAGIEDELKRLDNRSAESAFLKGRPDLNRIDPARVVSEQREIEKYLQVTNNDDMNYFDRSELAKSDSDLPFEAENSYKTDAVRNYFKISVTYNRLGVGGDPEKSLTPKQRELYIKLRNIVTDKDGKSIEHVSLTDPKTGETLSLSTHISRSPLFLAIAYGEDLPEEEVADMFEGLVFNQKHDLDLNDPKVYAYARKRLLDSMEKLFRLEMNLVKKYENTYGTLQNDIPLGCFMSSLGENLFTLAIHGHYSQDVAEMVDYETDSERVAIKDGKKMTGGQLLLSEGRVTQEEFDYLFDFNCKYYQLMTMATNSYFENPSKIFSKNEEKPGIPFALSDCIYMQNTVNNRKIKGPKLSFAKKRQLWKDAMKTGRAALTGNEDQINYEKLRYDLFTPAEKRALKDKRKKDSRIIQFYDSYLDEREEQVSVRVKALLGDAADKEAIKPLIAFHPVMANPDTSVDAGGPLEDAYIKRIKKYLGIGVPEAERSAERTKAYEELVNIWANTRVDADLLNIDGFMDNGKVRADESRLVKDSSVMKGEVSHRMYLAVMGMSGDMKNAGLFTDKHRESLEGGARAQLNYELLRKVLTDRDYTELKDVGNRYRTVPERMLGSALYINNQLCYGRGIKLKNGILTEDNLNVLKYYGINPDTKLLFEDPLLKNAVSGATLESKENVEKPKSENTEKVVFSKSTRKANEIPEYEGDPTAALPYAERVKIYTPEALITHTQALLDLGYNVPTSSDEVAFLRGELMDTVKDKNDVQHYVRKADVPAEVYEHLDWLGTYYKTQNDTLDQNVKDKPIHAIPIDIKVKAKMGIKGMVNAYEKQDTNNCFCVAGAALVNQFLSRHKRDKLVGQYVTQRDMRGFIPEIRKYDPAYADKGVSPEVYQRAVDEMKQYTGKNTSRPGNIYAMGDFILDALQKEGHGDAVLNKMEFMVPGDIQLTERNRNKANNMKAVMMSKIGEVINGGGIVSICYTDDVFVHYITVTEINGDRLTVLDSSGYAKKSREMSIDQFIQGGQTIELNWISDLKKPEEMTAEFSNLNYDAEHGYSVKDLPPEQAKAHILNVAHTKGISVNKTLAELGGDDYEGIFQHAYIPNPKVQVESMPIGEFSADEHAHDEIYFTTASNTMTITGEENKTENNTTSTKNKGETSNFSKTTRKAKTAHKEATTTEHKETTTTAHKETAVKKEPIIIPPYKMEGSVKKITDKAIAAFEKKCDEKIEPRQDYLDEKLQTYKQDNENKKMGYTYLDNIDEKLLTSLASHLAYFTNDTKEESMVFIRTVYVAPVSQSQNELREKARSYEKLFRAVMEFDIKKLNFSKPSDLITADKADVYVMAEMMHYLDPRLLPQYETLRGLVINIWPEEKMNEFKARWELLRNNYLWFTYIYGYLDLVQDENIDMSRLMSMKPDEVLKLSKSAESGSRLADFYKNLGTAMQRSSETGFGFGPGVDAELVLEKIRTEKYGLKPTVKKDDLSLQSEFKQIKVIAEKAKVPASDDDMVKTFGADNITTGLEETYKTGTQMGDISKGLSSMKKAKSVHQNPGIVPARAYLLEEERRLIEKRRSHNELIKLYLSDKHQKKILGDLTRKSDREVFRELYLQLNKGILEVCSSVIDDRRAMDVFMILNLVLPRIFNEDISRFEFGSDEEFVSGFALKYDFLCMAYSAGMLLKKYNTSVESMSIGRHMCEYMAKTEIYMELKQEYEDRMKLISSPYYEYLKGADLSAYKGKSGETLMSREGLPADLKDYIRLHHKVAAAKYSTNLRANYESRLKAIRKDKGKADLAVLKSYFKGVNINQPPTDVILEVFEKKKNAVKRSYPKDDREFQEKHRIYTGGMILYGIEDDKDKIINAEKELIDIMYEGTFRGEKLSAKVQKSASKVIKEYFNLRREHMAGQGALKYTQASENVCGCDICNPILLKSKEGRLLSDISCLEGMPASKMDEINRLSGECFAKLFSVYSVLLEEGVVLNEKLQAPMQDARKIDEAVEKRRSALDKKMKSRGNKDAHFEFQTFIFNGKQYTEYALPDDSALKETMTFFKQFNQVNVSEASREELTGLMGELTGIMKKRLAAISLYDSLKGEKVILHVAYSGFYDREIKRISERIKDILGNK